MPLYLTSRKCLVEVNGILGSKLIYLVKEKQKFQDILDYISWPIIYSTSKVHLKVVRLEKTTLM